MRDLFDEVDVDGNGYVTRIELSQSLSGTKIQDTEHHSALLAE